MNEAPPASGGEMISRASGHTHPQEEEVLIPPTPPTQPPRRCFLYYSAGKACKTKAKPKGWRETEELPRAPLRHGRGQETGREGGRVAVGRAPGVRGRPPRPNPALHGWCRCPG